MGGEFADFYGGVKMLKSCTSRIGTHQARLRKSTDAASYHVRYGVVNTIAIARHIPLHKGFQHGQKGGVRTYG